MKVQDLKDTPRRNEELKNLEADMPRLLEKAAKSCKAKTGVVCDGFQRYDRASHCAHAGDGSLAGSLASARGCEVATQISF